MESEVEKLVSSKWPSYSSPTVMVHTKKNKKKVSEQFEFG